MNEPPYDVPHPVLFNAWKHHALALKRRIAEAAAEGDTGLAALPEKLLVVGTELMDLYTGCLTPKEIGEGVVTQLAAMGFLPRDVFRGWVAANGGYQVLTFPSDESAWVLRFADKDDRYLHVHPGRWTPNTKRVRANVVKTAVMVLAHAAVHGGDVLDVKRINLVRQEYLGLAPIRDLSKDQGLDSLLKILSD